MSKRIDNLSAADIKTMFKTGIRKAYKDVDLFTMKKHLEYGLYVYGEIKVDGLWVCSETVVWLDKKNREFNEFNMWITDFDPDHDYVDCPKELEETFMRYLNFLAEDKRLEMIAEEEAAREEYWNECNNYEESCWLNAHVL